MSHNRWQRITILASALVMAGLFLSTSEVRAGENKGRISLSAGVDFPTAYFFRGILQEDGGFIAQPYVDATLTLYEGEKGLNSVGATLGIWNSFHAGASGGSGPNSDPKIWYEADLYGGFTFGLFDKFETGVTYTAYTSPNGAFSTVQEVSFSFSFDDSDLLGPFALSPSALLAVEVKGQADGGSNKGVYLQLGVEPGLTLIESEKYPVSLSFPLTLGLSLSDYYQDPVTGDDSTFGYFDLGVALSMPLGFIPADYGSWDFYVKGDFLFLGNSLEAINNDEDFQAIATIGVSLAY
ncbi:MAG: hypothetical protein ACE5JQ_13565 [Candidatus Methylomirabilales bacterium]